VSAAEGYPVKITRDMLIATRFGEDTSDEKWKERVLERSGRDFEEHGDPLWPWHVLRLAADWGIPAPAWVMLYFSEQAERLNKIVRDGGGNGSKEAELVGRALGFGAAGKGNTSAGKAIRTKDRDYQIAFWVICRIEEHKQSHGVGNIDGAKHDAAKYFGVSISTVGRALEEWRAAAEQHVADLTARRGQS